MAKDTVSGNPLLDKLVELHETLIDPDVVEHIGALRKRRSRENDDVVRHAHAAQSLAGTQGTKEALAEAQRTAKATTSELARWELEVVNRALSAAPDFAAIALDLYTVAESLAGVMRAVDQHVADTGHKHLPQYQSWSTASAAANALHALAVSLGPAPVTQKVTISGIRWWR